jgi:hypothetical protein
MIRAAGISDVSRPDTGGVASLVERSFRDQRAASREATATRASILSRANWPLARRINIVALRLASGTSIAMISDCIRFSLDIVSTRARAKQAACQTTRSTYSASYAPAPDSRVTGSVTCGDATRRRHRGQCQPGRLLAARRWNDDAGLRFGFQRTADSSSVLLGESACLQPVEFSLGRLLRHYLGR